MQRLFLALAGLGLAGLVAVAVEADPPRQTAWWPSTMPPPWPC